jgi:hypothetical protein
MKLNSGVLLLCACLVLVAQARATVLPDACGDDKVKFDVTTSDKKSALPEADTNKATFIFVQRNRACMGCSAVRVGIDGTWVGANKSNSYFAVTVPPGEHHLCALWGAPLARIENKLGLTDWQADPGQAYYFEIEVESHGSEDTPKMHLKPISPDMGKFLISRSKLSVAKPKVP